MLLRLIISNYALIQNLDIGLSGGLTVITGETGAGKSILVGALSLILGNRADTSVLLSHKEKCIVEGHFSIEGYGLEGFFEENDLDVEPIVILRREINQSGKSRAFINDTPVSLNLMKELGDQLVNIHSQHAITTLQQADFQMTVLDDFAGHLPDVNAYKKQFASFRKLQQHLAETREKISLSRSEQDYKQFLLNELTQASLQAGELEDLESRLSTLTHAEEIKRCISKATLIISTSDDSILLRLTESLSLLNPVAAFQPELDELRNRIESNLIDMKDVAMGLEQINESLEIDPQETERVANRLDLLYRLQQKHHCTSIEELIKILDHLQQQHLENEEDEVYLTSLEKQLQQNSAQLLVIAEQLSEKRKNAIPGFCKEIETMLRELGMPDASFSIDARQTDQLTEDGLDQVRFYFSANKGVPRDEIARVASGGELSRLMLSVKSMISRKNLLPTIVFDEIDNGVSGDIAGKVGNILKRIAHTMQVIVITHLPQIAGMGSHHYQVFKESVDEITRSAVRKLNREERVEEGAKMVSSEKVTAAAFETARELLTE